MSRSPQRWSFLGLLVCVVLTGPTFGCMPKPGFLDLQYPDVAVFEVGSDIRIECSLRNNTFTDAKNEWHTQVDHSNLRFRSPSNTFDESSEFVEKVNENTIAYVKKNATPSDSTSLMCIGEGRDDKNETHLFAGCYTSLFVGKPPLKVIDFKCTSNSFINMTCSWQAPENKVRTTYTVEISSGIQRAFGAHWSPCPANHSTPTSCLWTDTSKPALDKLAHEFYFRVNGSNALGNASWEFHFSHGSIVKLSPVSKLRVSLDSPTEANLVWDSPDETKHGGWKDELPIEYSLTINRLNSVNSETIETRQTTLRLTDMLPNKKYQVLVRARTSSTQRFDLYSDPRAVTFTMAKDKPSRPPTLLPSAFKYKLFGSVRTVTLLFDEIPNTHWNDDSFHYIVQVCSRAEEKCYNKTTEHTNVDLEELSVTKRYYIDVWSANSLGVSSSSQSIVIGPQSELFALPTDVVVLLGNRSASLSWKTPQTLVKHEDLKADVYWCESPDQQRCRGAIHTSQLNNTESMRIDNVTEPRDYIYGVALTEANGRTSGSVWSVCEINAGAHVGQVRELEALPDTDSTLKLHWRTGCGYQRRDVEGYQVELCHVEHNPQDVLTYAEECQHRRPTNNSSTPCRVLNFTLPTEEDVFVVDNLQKNEVYRVVLRAVDGVTHKFAPDSLAVCAVVKGAGLPPRIVVAIAIGSALVFTLVFLVLYFLGKRMRGELDTAKSHKICVPKALEKRKLNQRKQLKQGTEFELFEANNMHHYQVTDDRIMTSGLTNGSHSSSEKLISPSAIECPPVPKDSMESSNLNGEPPIAVSVEVPDSVFIPQPIPNGNSQYVPPPMPSYTQLGLSASHFVAMPEQPRYTGYSQLSVVPTPPAAGEEDDAEEEHDEHNEDDDDDNIEDDEGEDRAATPEPEAAPRRTPYNPDYIALDAAFTKNNGASNGYVPAVRAKQ